MINKPITDWSWEITRRCNLKCLHCISDTPAPELGKKESLRVVETIANLGGKTLRITGGEPLLRKDLGEITARASASGLELGIISNGTKIDSCFLRKYGRFFSHIAISIDGTEEINDQIRGAGVYKKATSAIRKIVDRGISVSVYTTINMLNRDSLSSMLAELLEVGVSNFHLNDLNLQGRAWYNKSLLLPRGSLEAKFESIVSQLGQQLELDRKGFSVDNECTISPSMIYLASNGDLFPCTEIAFSSNPIRIESILAKDFDERINNFFSQLVKPEDCCYTLFSSPGMSILLNRQGRCKVAQSKE